MPKVVEFIKVSNILKENYPALNICTNNGSTVRVMQWQCGGEIAIDPTTGVKKEDALFLEKSLKFIEKAIEINSDLVLTPEYSFPFTVLQNIIDESSLWPKQGQLWCLGMQGESRNILFRKLEDWSNIQNVNLISLATDNLEVKNFVSALIYLFRTVDQKLCILPQFKTGSMADQHNIFEGPNLCRGKHIFIFDLGEQVCENVFLSLICADALKISTSEITSMPGRHIILFHPQLNPQPRHDGLVIFRKNFYSTDQKDVRIITLNWADRTFGDFEGHPHTFAIPWSAYFKKSKTSQPLIEQAQRSNKEENHKKGTPYIVSDRIDVWFSDRIEHCKSFIISKGDNGNNHLAIVSRDDPTTENCYTFDEQTKVWTERTKCASNVQDLFKQFNETMDFPYPVCCSDTSKCDKCKKTDFFFGSLFGKFENHEIACSSEKVTRFLVSADKETDSLRNEKFDMLMHLKRLLASGKFPKALKYLENNYIFEISEDFPMQGRDNYNISPKVATHIDGEALVVITNEMTLSRVKTLVQQLIENLSKRYRNQILVYYKSPGNGYLCYDDHLSDKSITLPMYTANNTSYKNADSNMIRRKGDIR